MEQTLFICREVDLYKLPPRGTATGWRSGDWRVDDKIFTARCRVVATDSDKLEVRLEDPSNGEIFGLCPVPLGQRDIAVECATDSSRNFVLRLEDPVTKRHAFIGMNFAERSNAFDFNVSLTDFEKQAQREKEIKQLSTAANPVAQAQQTLPEAAALYRHEDLSLKEGQHIRIEVKKKTAGDGSSFLSRLGGQQQTNNSNAAAGGIKILAPPPPQAPAATRLAPPPPASTAQVLQGEAAVAAFDSFDAFASAPSRTTAGNSDSIAAGSSAGNTTNNSVQQPPATSSDAGGWATF